MDHYYTDHCNMDRYNKGRCVGYDLMNGNPVLL